MARKYVFEKNNAGIVKLLQSQQCLSLMEKYARGRAGSNYIRPFIGYDRAKVFIKSEK